MYFNNLYLYIFNNTLYIYIYIYLVIYMCCIYSEVCTISFNYDYLSYYILGLLSASRHQHCPRLADCVSLLRCKYQQVLTLFLASSLLQNNKLIISVGNMQKY